MLCSVFNLPIDINLNVIMYGLKTDFYVDLTLY
jgi:hypothetical protein